MTEINQISARRCTNCAAFEGGECLNAVSFAVVGTDGQPEQLRPPKARDNCPDHRTHAEDAAEDLAWIHFRNKLAKGQHNP